MKPGLAAGAGREPPTGGEPDETDDVIRELHELAGEPDGFEQALEVVALSLGAAQLHLRLTTASGVTLAESVVGGPPIFGAGPPSAPDGVEPTQPPITPEAHEQRFVVVCSLELEVAVEKATLAVARWRENGDFGDAERARLRRLAPQVAVAWRNARRSRSVQSDARALRAALDALPNAVAIVDRELRVTSANDLAEELLDGRDRVRIQDGRLVAPRGTEGALASGIEGVLREVRSGHAQPTRTIAVAREGHEPLSIVLTPLGVGPKRRVSRLLAIFANPSRSVQVDPERVATLHGLTRVEAELAAALVEGLTITEFAIRRGCSEQTARTHLKRVLEKTRTNRQTDLVRLLLADMAHHQSR